MGLHLGDHFRIWRAIGENLSQHNGAVDIIKLRFSLQVYDRQPHWSVLVVMTRVLLL